MKEQQAFGRIISMYFFNSLFLEAHYFCGSWYFCGPVLGFIPTQSPPQVCFYACPHMLTHWRKSTTHVGKVHYSYRKTGQCFSTMTSNFLRMFPSMAQSRVCPFLIDEQYNLINWAHAPSEMTGHSLSVCASILVENFTRGAQRACVPAARENSNEN